MRQFALLDVCMPDYFTGYHIPVVAVPLSGEITHSEIAEMIKNEFNYTYELYEEIKDYEQLLDKYIEYLIQEPDIVFYEGEEPNDEMECVYAYFSIINPKTVNGITFLN